MFIFLRLNEKDVRERLQSKEFYEIYDILSYVQQELIDMIMRNSDKVPTGRRYTEEQKIIALSIIKRSAKCCRFL